MARIKLIVSYDGTAYVGWQYQPNGLSVQQCLEEALAKLTGQVHVLHSSGRTDSGVHALGMVCHFTSERQLPLTAWREGINGFLPADIAVRTAEVVADDFHARYHASGKHYRYTVLRDGIRRPLERRTSWQLKYSLDLERMRRAAQQFVGSHDFSAFRTSGCSAATTQREVFSVDLIEEGALLHIDVRGGGFLRNMVRMMAGTLVEIGRDKRPVGAVAGLLQNPTGGKPAVTAPAHGLCLMEVFY